MRGTLGYWTSVAGQAMRQTASSFFSPTLGLVHEIIAFILGLVACLYFFGERGLAVAADEVLWASAVACALGLTFIFECAVRFISLPARRERELQIRIEQLTPGAPELLDVHRSILRACRDSRPEHGHVMSGGSQCTIDGIDVQYWTPAVEDAIEYMERNGLVTVFGRTGSEVVFSLTDLGAIMRADCI